MGDVILMSSLFPILHKNFPGIKIGVLIAKSSGSVFQEHPLIEKIHYLDHWKLVREKLSWFHKWKKYKKSFQKALLQVQEEKYEVAIDVCYHFPSAAPFLYKAKIPVRIGYVSAGFFPLLTHSKKWKLQKKSAAEYFRDLLSFLTPLSKESLKPSIPTPFQYKRVFPEYILIHMGTGSELKKWPNASWKKLVEKLGKEKLPLVFTGKGEKEMAEIREVTEGLTRGCFSVRQVDWQEYVFLIQKAKGLIAVDTVAGHVAACFSIPSVLIYTGIALIENWKPLNEKAEILSKPLPCYPCYRSRGCKEMRCIREVSVDEVLQKTKTLLYR